METLVKVDPIRHMHRWYSVGVQSSLVDGICVVYGWGSLKSAFQQWRILQVQSQEDGEKLVARMVAQKMKKGYVRRSKGGAMKELSSLLDSNIVLS